MTHAPSQVRIANVVGIMEGLSQRLTERWQEGLKSPSARRIWAAEAARHARTVEDICEAHQTVPGDLEPRTRHAYAWLHFIGDQANLEAHLEAVVQARAANAERPPRMPGRFPLFVGMASLWRSRMRGGLEWHRFHEPLIAAPGDFFRDFFHAVETRNRRLVGQLLRGADEEEAVAEVRQELEAPIQPSAARMVGRHHDLAESFDRVNAEYFDGRLPRPTLLWNKSPTVRIFGHYQFQRDTVTITQTLDQPDVPTFVVDFIMYHELLHKKHGLHDSGGRRYAHTAAFRADERRYRHYAEAQDWLARLARRQRRRR